jgi:hypothetical protein
LAQSEGPSFSISVEFAAIFLDSHEPAATGRGGLRTIEINGTSRKIGKVAPLIPASAAFAADAETWSVEPIEAVFGNRRSMDSPAKAQNSLNSLTCGRIVTDKKTGSYLKVIRL